MTDFTTDFVKIDNAEQKIKYNYSCMTRTDVDKAIKLHKKLYSIDAYKPIKIESIQFMDWKRGGRGIWNLVISHNHISISV
tara:strand:+ start:189 stop:431 length:243 start_codon:yes stop_codon:yes gene_type:complete